MDASGTFAQHEGAPAKRHSGAGLPVEAAATDECWAVRVTHQGLRRVYTRRIRTVQVAFLLFATALAIAGPIGELMMGDPVAGPRVAGVVTAIGLLMAFRWWRAAIVVAPGSVTIRGLLYSRQFDVNSVARFEPPAPYGRLWHTGMRVCLSDGRVRRAGVFAATPIDGAAVGSEEAAELNWWLATQRENASQAGNLPTPQKGSLGARVAWGVWVGIVAFLALITVTFGLAGVDPSQYGS